MTNPHGHKFIFICGLHRSGTSPLFKLLRDHPQISGFRDTGVPEDEGQHLQTLFPAAKHFGGPGEFGFHPEAHLTETSPLASSQSCRTLFAEWSRHWDLSKPYLLEKSPPNLIRTRLLQALFPQSLFLVLLRHPIAVSLATLKWTDSSLESLLDHWFQCHKIFDEDRAKLRNVLVLKYEDLARATQAELDRIHEFLGVSSQAAQPLDATANSRYFEMWSQRVMQNPQLLDRIYEKYDSRMQDYGYSALPDGPLVPQQRQIANSSKIHSQVVAE